MTAHDQLSDALQSRGREIRDLRGEVEELHNKLAEARALAVRFERELRVLELRPEIPWWVLLVGPNSRVHRALATLGTAWSILCRHGVGELSLRVVRWMRGERGYWKGFMVEALDDTRLDRGGFPPWMKEDPVTWDGQPPPAVRLVVDHPSDGSTVAAWLQLSGWAMDPQAAQGSEPGVRAIRVFLGSRIAGPMLAEAAVGVGRPDVVESLELAERFELCGFETGWIGLPPGPQSLSISAIGDDGRVLTNEVVRVVVRATEEVIGELSFGDRELRAFAAREDASARTLAEQRRVARSWGVRPQFRILTSFDGADEEAFHRTARSLDAQTWPDWSWELCGIDGARPGSLRELEASDSRVRSTTDDVAANEVVGQPGEESWLLPLELGAVLSPNALFEVAEVVRRQPHTKVVTADGDRLDGTGRRVSPSVAPSRWCPIRALSTNPASNLIAFRAASTSAAATPGREAVQDDPWAVALAMVSAPEHAHHLPRILIHRPLGAPAPPYPAAAVQATLQRVGIDATIRRSGDERPRIEWSPPGGETISIIIPSRSEELLRRCIGSLCECGDHANYEIVVVATGDESVWRRMSAMAEAGDGQPRIRVERCVLRDGEFNFHTACNLGARAAAGRNLLFLNDDVEVVTPDWLDRLRQWLSFDDVAVVGAKLLYPDGTIQHAGVAVGIGGFASHLYRGLEEHHPTLFEGEDQYRQCSAVTAACCMVRRSAFEEVGGFDERFALNFGDVDLCLRLGEAGWRCVYTPDARLVHRESSSRRHAGSTAIPRRDWELFAARWMGFLQRGDPFLSPLLSVLSETPRLRTGPLDNPSSRCDHWMKHLPDRPVIVLPGDMEGR